MPTATTMPPPDFGRASLIKPHLVRISGSGRLLDEVMVERAVERGIAVSQTGLGRLPGHMIVLPRRKASNLKWSVDDKRRSSLFLPGEIIINPDQNAVTPRWDINTEIVLQAIR